MTENGPRAKNQPPAESARSAPKDPRGPRTYLPGYYLG